MDGCPVHIVSTFSYQSVICHLVMAKWLPKPVSLSSLYHFYPAGKPDSTNITLRTSYKLTN